MNRRDKQTIEMLREELIKQSDSAKIPQRLQKDSIVKMLGETEKNNIKTVDFSDNTGADKNGSMIYLRKLTAIAAMLVIIVGCALIMRAESGVRVIPSDYAGRSGTLVKCAESYEEIERTVEKILGKEQSSQQSDKNKEPQTAATTAVRVIDKLFNKSDKTESFKSENVGIDSLVSEGVEVISKFEADIVRNDGTYLYVVTKGKNAENGATIEQIKVVKAVPATEIGVAATIVLSDGSDAAEVDECFEIYLHGNTLIALMNRYGYALADSNGYDKFSTVAVYYDITDPTKPVKIREHVQDGKFVSSDISGEKLCLVTAKSISAASAEAGMIPSFSINGEVNVPKAENIFIAVNDPEASYLFITSTNIANPDAPVRCLAVLGSGKTVTCSADVVLLSRGFVSVDADESGNHKKLTEIYRFNIGNESIDFAGSYVVDGSVIGNICYDSGSSRAIVASKGVSSTSVCIFNEKMELVGSIDGLLSGESVKNVRFIGTNCYIYSGENNGKTTVVDFSNPEKPQKGQSFEGAGFTEKIYSVSESALITFEKLTSGEGLQLSLFDISSSSIPEIISKYELSEGFVLPDETDIRSIMIDSEKKLLGIPMIKKNPATGTDILSYVLFSVTDGVISPVGTYNHDTQYTDGDAAVRGTSIGDILYTVSGSKITAFSISEGIVIGTQEIK